MPLGMVRLVGRQPPGVEGELDLHGKGWIKNKDFPPRQWAQTRRRHRSSQADKGTMEVLMLSHCCTEHRAKVGFNFFAILV